MEPERSIQAAPNRSRIEGRLASFERDETFPDKFWIDFQMVSSEDLPDVSNFAKGKVGKAVRGFTFEEPSLHPGDRFTAAAEYVGDAKKGLFRLSGIQKYPTR